MHQTCGVFKKLQQARYLPTVGCAGQVGLCLPSGAKYSTIWVMLSKAVIDTNVVFAGLYSASGASHQILRLVEQGAIKPLLSTALLFEYEEVLRRNQAFLGLSDLNIKDVLDGFCARREYRRIHFLWRPTLSDPKDDHVLELAVAANNADIVTHNIRDFVQASQFNVRVVTPSCLWRELK